MSIIQKVPIDLALKDPCAICTGTLHHPMMGHKVVSTDADGKTKEVWHAFHEECENVWHKVKTKCAVCLREVAYMPTTILEAMKLVVDAAIGGEEEPLSSAIKIAEELFKIQQIADDQITGTNVQAEDIDFVITSNVINGAAAGGHLKLLQAWKKKSIPLNCLVNAVIYAGNNGHPHIIRELLLDSACVSSPLFLGNALIGASYSNDSELVREILTTYSIEREYYIKAIKIVVIAGHDSVLFELVKTEEDRGYAVVAASEAKRLDSIKELLKDGAQISDGFRSKAAIAAAGSIAATKDRHCDILEELLKEHSLSIFEEEDRTLILYAIVNYCDNMEFLQRLIQTKEHRNYSLRLAALNGEVKVVTEILKKADTLSDHDLLVALSAASTNGHFAIIEVLLKARATCFGSTMIRMTAIVNSLRNKEIKTTAFLLKPRSMIEASFFGLVVCNELLVPLYQYVSTLAESERS